MAKKKEPSRATEHGGQALTKLTEGDAPLPESTPPKNIYDITKEEFEALEALRIEKVKAKIEEMRKLGRSRQFRAAAIPELKAALLYICKMCPGGIGGGVLEGEGYDRESPDDRKVLDTFEKWYTLPGKQALWTGIMVGEALGVLEGKTEVAVDISQARADSVNARWSKVPDRACREAVIDAFLGQALEMDGFILAVKRGEHPTIRVKQIVETRGDKKVSCYQFTSVETLEKWPVKKPMTAHVLSQTLSEERKKSPCQPTA